jgi:peroxiredoxin Q/BCP
MSDIPKTGDKAPGFEAETYGGEKIRLSDYKGKSTIALYFYPKDNTPVWMSLKNSECRF